MFRTFLLLRFSLIHGMAFSDNTNLDIQILQHEGTLNIVKEDNGKEFDKKTVKSGLGIANIKRKLASLKGSLSINSSIGYGCSIIVNVPV